MIPRTRHLRLCATRLLVVLALCGCTAQPPAPSVPVPTSRQEAFRVAEQNGAWSFIDPDGQPFFSTGISCINPADAYDVAAPKYQGLSKHGGNLDRWGAATLSRLREWRVNTIGAWSSLRGQPYVVELSLSYSWIDVFGDEFVAYVEQAARRTLDRPDVGADFAALDADPNLIGYFTDNELAWGWDYGWDGNPKHLSLFEYFATLPPDAPGKKAWAAYLVEVYDGDAIVFADMEPDRPWAGRIAEGGSNFPARTGTLSAGEKGCGRFSAPRGAAVFRGHEQPYAA